MKKGYAIPSFEHSKDNSKEAIRGLALKWSGISKAAILFPSAMAIDLANGTEAGIFCPEKTFMLCVEENEAIADKVEQKLRDLRYENWHVHRGNVTSLDGQKMRRFFGNRKVDFAFFDFCGQLTKPLAYWLAIQCDGLFAKKAQLSFTFSLQTRNLLNKLLLAIDVSASFPLLGLSEQQLCLEICGRDDPKQTLIAAWLALSSACTIEFKTHRYGYAAQTYKSNKTPMLFFTVKVKDTASAMSLRHLVNLTDTR